MSCSGNTTSVAKCHRVDQEVNHILQFRCSACEYILNGGSLVSKRPDPYIEYLSGGSRDIFERL